MIPPDTIIQRLTGDPRKSQLVAPEWTLHKQETLQAIEREFERRGTRQGHCWKG
jgi:radical SAM superfamily enzyme